MYTLSTKEKHLCKRVISPYYMKPIIENAESLLKDKNDPKEWKELFNKLHDILRDSEKEVNELLRKRKEKGEISNIEQARKSIAGNAFSNLLIYVFLKNKIYENIHRHIFITNRTSEVKGFEKLATINIGSDTQKPDVDIIIYTENNEGLVDRCIILSLKTSLRERAGQTYKWKLLLEIATTNNPIKEKYKIDYEPNSIPLICFATVNFYNEINRPQHRGMLRFFDKAFIAKPIQGNDLINPLSELVDFVNEVLKGDK